MGLNFFGFWGSLGRRLVCLFVCFCFFEGLFFNFANFIVLGRLRKISMVAGGGLFIFKWNDNFVTM